MADKGGASRPTFLLRSSPASPRDAPSHPASVPPLNLASTIGDPLLLPTRMLTIETDPELFKALGIQGPIEARQGDFVNPFQQIENVREQIRTRGESITSKLHEDAESRELLEALAGALVNTETSSTLADGEDFSEHIGLALSKEDADYLKTRIMRTSRAVEDEWPDSPLNSERGSKRGTISPTASGPSSPTVSPRLFDSHGPKATSPRPKLSALLASPRKTELNRSLTSGNPSSPREVLSSSPPMSRSMTDVPTRISSNTSQVIDTLVERLNSSPQSPSKKKRGGKHKTCFKCDQTLNKSTGIKVLGSYWHRTCFGCSLCSKPIKLPGPYVTHSGKPFCMSCKNPMQICLLCHQSTERGNSLILGTRGSIHSGCYAVLKLGGHKDLKKK